MTGRAAALLGTGLLALGVMGLLVGTGLAGARGFGPGPGFMVGYGPGVPAAAAGGTWGPGPFRMMDGDVQFAEGQLIDAAGLTALVRDGEAGAHVDRSTDTVTYSGRSVTLVALSSPHGIPDMRFEIDGLVNPTVIVPQNARLTFHLVNTDWGEVHGLAVTTTPPPYPFMAMMATSDRLFLWPLPPRSTRNLATAEYAASSAGVTLAAGSYDYLCPVPGHAQQGMYGRLVVR